MNDTRDFGIGRRLHDLARLGQVGFSANRRLLASNEAAATSSPEKTPMTGSAVRWC